VSLDTSKQDRNIIVNALIIIGHGIQKC